LLHAELSRHFSPDLVFLDSESIPAGADFVEHILARVRQARVVLAVIGIHWLTAIGPGDKRRLDDPADWIRQELVTAFAAGVRVIPVLTDAAAMPTEADLPADLAPLARCQYRRLRHREASADLARLVGELATIDEALGAAARRQGGVPQQLPAAVAHFAGVPRRSRWWLLGGGMAAVALAIGATVFFARLGDGPPADHPASTSSAGSPPSGGSGAGAMLDQLVQVGDAAVRLRIVRDGGGNMYAECRVADRVQRCGSGAATSWTAGMRR
jgi:hypothetical protein